MPRDPDRGERIAALRGHVPQPVIADKIPVTLRAYQEWEAGGGLAWDNLVKLARIFKVDTSAIMEGPAEPLEPTQLDRVERKLDALVSQATAETPEEIAEAAALLLEAKRHAVAQTAQTNTKKGRAA